MVSTLFRNPILNLRSLWKVFALWLTGWPACVSSENRKNEPTLKYPQITVRIYCQVNRITIEITQIFSEDLVIMKIHWRSLLMLLMSELNVSSNFSTSWTFKIAIHHLFLLLTYIISVCLKKEFVWVTKWQWIPSNSQAIFKLTLHRTKGKEETLNKMMSWSCLTCWPVKLWRHKKTSLVNKSADWTPNYNKILIFSPQNLWKVSMQPE